MTPVGIEQDPRPVLMLGNEPNTVAELMALIDLYATALVFAGGDTVAAGRATVEAAIRSALDAA